MTVREVWLDEEGGRYYLLPVGTDLPAGDHPIVNLRRMRALVDGEALAPHEVPEAEALAHARAQLDAAWTQARDMLGELIAKAGLPNPMARSVNEALWGIDPAEAMVDPEATRRKVRGRIAVLAGRFARAQQAGNSSEEVGSTATATDEHRSPPLDDDAMRRLREQYAALARSPEVLDALSRLGEGLKELARGVEQAEGAGEE